MICHFDLIWRKINVLSGHYEVSNTGLIRNGITMKVLLQHTTKKGYKTITLPDNGSIKSFRIHRLVALGFIDNPDKKEYVNHKNGIKNDNRQENLEWCTASENMIHSYRETGRKSNFIKYNQSTSKFKKRYLDAHRQHAEQNYPNVCKDDLYSPPVLPKINTANGLTTAIVNYINWTGNRATRINVQGRLVEGEHTTESGATFAKKKWIKSSTRKGTADISSTINGKSAMWEIKIASDKPSEAQLKEQERERKAGGIYEFIKTIDQFFEVYDRLFKGYLFI